VNGAKLVEVGQDVDRDAVLAGQVLRERLRVDTLMPVRILVTSFRNAGARNCPRRDWRYRLGAVPRGDYAYEVKWDGFRAIVSTEDGLRVWSRRGWDMTERVAERKRPRPCLVTPCGRDQPVIWLWI
jgi:hypothetical protein